MDDTELREAATACGDEFLNREAAPKFIPDADGTHVEAFIEGEVIRFGNYLRSYINEHLMSGDFVGVEDDSEEDDG